MRHQYSVRRVVIYVMCKLAKLQTCLALKKTCSTPIAIYALYFHSDYKDHPYGKVNRLQCEKQIIFPREAV